MGTDSFLSPRTLSRKTMELQGARGGATRGAATILAKNPPSAHGFLITQGHRTRMATSTQMTQL
jgi:hypothetical protein